MRELALHILDIAQNSIAAKATKIIIEVHENENGFFVFRIKDNGCGMSEEMVRNVRDPFVTTRKTRKVGMGIPFMDMVTEQCGGHLDIFSQVGKGTEVAAYFEADNIDRPPLGNIVESIKVLLVGAPDIDLDFTYTCLGGAIVFKTEEMREVLGDACDFTNPAVYGWLEDYLTQQLNKVQSREDYK